MKTLIKTLLVPLFLAAPMTALAKPQIFACEPEWASLAKELVQDAADIYTATTAAQDPHHIEARPSLLAAARRADMLLCTGAELESGWLPILLRESGNDKIQAGNAGYFMASDYVDKLDIPQSVDRSQGDIHAAGNPHIHLDPRNIAMVTRAMSDAMVDAFPEMKLILLKNRDNFAQRWTAAMTRWVTQTQTLRGTPVFVQHINWRYLTHWLDLKVIAALEPKPGIPPNAGHLSRLLEQQQKTPGKMVLVAGYEDAKPARWLSEKTGMPVVTLPFTTSDDVQDLFQLYDKTIDQLLNAVKAHE